MTIGIMPTISILNVYYLDEVYDWAQKHNFSINVNYLHEPKEFSLSNLTELAQNLIIKKFQGHPWYEMHNMLTVIKKLPPTDGKTFLEKIKWFDSVREENFKNSHKEIAEAMGYV